MKVYIGPYNEWLGPYQLAEKLCFWVPKTVDEYGVKRHPDWVDDFGEWLAHGSVIPDDAKGSKFKNNRPKTWIYKLLKYFDNTKTRKVQIRIDPYDTWSMDHTLALIVLPMLKQLRDTKHGSPSTDLEDVPECFHPNPNAPVVTEGKPLDNDEESTIHSRWNWILNEIIHAFECEVDDNWEDQFHSGEHDTSWELQENGCYKLVNGPNDTWEVDREAMEAAWKRRKNGLRLFGKYYHGLWD